jgi:hypothetical protein
MNDSLKVQPHHLKRGAYLYVRQSSMRQVIENVESTKRQYALRGRATALGWRDDQIIVIDSDQGESGASASWREGFQRLVTDVGMGRAGIVIPRCLFPSRVSRSAAPWNAQRRVACCGSLREATLAGAPSQWPLGCRLFGYYAVSPFICRRDSAADSWAR